MHPDPILRYKLRREGGLILRALLGGGILYWIVIPILSALLT